MGQMRAGLTVPSAVSAASKRFELRWDSRWQGDTLVAKTLASEQLISPGSPASLSLFAGGGTERSTLASMVGVAEAFQGVRDGHAKRTERGLPVRVAANGLAWPYHGGPSGVAYHDLTFLMSWLGTYFCALGSSGVPLMAVGRSFGGTALLEYVLRNDGQLTSVIAMSPYTPSWTAFVLKVLAGKGRNFNLPGWQFMLQLDGMLSRDATEPLTQERLMELTAEYGAMPLAEYAQWVRDRAQWTFPRELYARLDRMRGIDPSVDQLWNQSWNQCSQQGIERVFSRAEALRAKAGYSPLRTAVTIFFSETDDQYPQAALPLSMPMPELGARPFWQAVAVAFGVRILPVRGHDPLAGSFPDPIAVKHLYGMIRGVVDGEIRLPG